MACEDWRSEVEGRDRIQRGANDSRTVEEVMTDIIFKQLKGKEMMCSTGMPVWSLSEQ